MWQTCVVIFKDYDELATGQRREGQFTMARDLVPKICEIPADALPFLLMSCSFASQWDHGLDTFQPNRELVTSTSQTAHCKPPLQTSCARFLGWKELNYFLASAGYFQYNPDLEEQPEEVQWIIRGSLSILPGLAGLCGSVALFFFTLRTKDWTARCR